MPPDAVLIQLIEYTPNADHDANPGEFESRPARFRLEPEAFQNYECWGESYLVTFLDAGRKLQAAVKLGEEARPETVNAVLAVLGSLEISAG